MKLVRAIVRPEKSDQVMAGLLQAGYPAVTKVAVFGRGKQRGLKVGDITYDELPKDLLIVVVSDSDAELVVRTVMENARTGSKGNFGDGKVFVSQVDEIYTISSGIKEE
jgi:nitrogen regulatory protein PII 1